MLSVILAPFYSGKAQVLLIRLLKCPGKAPPAKAGCDGNHMILNNSEARLIDQSQRFGEAGVKLKAKLVRKGYSR